MKRSGNDIRSYFSSFQGGTKRAHTSDSDSGPSKKNDKKETKPRTKVLVLSSDDEDEVKKVTVAASKKRGREDDDNTFLVRSKKERKLEHGRKSSTSSLNLKKDNKIQEDTKGQNNFKPKEFPEAEPGCLNGKQFAFTGILKSFGRADVIAVIKKYGGQAEFNKKVDFIIIGSKDAKESKIKKAKSVGALPLYEDDFLNLLRQYPPIKKKGKEEKPSQDSGIFDPNSQDFKFSPIKATSSQSKASINSKKETKASSAKTESSKAKVDSRQQGKEKYKKEEAKRNGIPSTLTNAAKETKSNSIKVESSSSSSKSKVDSTRKIKEEDKKNSIPSTSANPVKPDSVKIQPSSLKPPVKSDIKKNSIPSTSIYDPIPRSTLPTPVIPASSLMWVDKYKPTSLKSIVGQIGDSCNSRKLLGWLENWFKNHGSSKDKAKSAWPGLKDPYGRTFKVALLSGPPGVGKTTTAHLCLKELGITYTELNASNTRNKKSLQCNLSDALTNCGLYFPNKTGNQDDGTIVRKHAVIMDEVDGMSGNEDRGGMQELIGLLKSSRIPIIFICNDRHSQKIRSLANYCFDLRFTKPTPAQLKGFIQKICFQEKIKIPPEVQQRLIMSIDQDVRQILHMMQMFKESSSGDTYDPKKDLRLGPWDVVRKVFSAQDHQGMTLEDKAQLFFQDYNIGPLFVHENYLKCAPRGARGNRFQAMDLVKSTAVSLVFGDMTESIIRRTNNWSLLPIQGIFQSVLPGEYMETNSVPHTEFPHWLGRNSNQRKRSRILQQLHTHMHLHVSTSLEALNMDYVPYLRRAIVDPLMKHDVSKAAGIMTDYSLIRDDLETISELALWPHMKDPLSTLDPKSKAAFTRQVNKESFVPYSVIKAVSKRGRGGGGEDEFGPDDGEDADELSSEDDIGQDAMIKMKKPKAKAESKPSSSQSKSTKSKRGGRK